MTTDNKQNGGKNQWKSGKLNYGILKGLLPVCKNYKSIKGLTPV
jgi:hypothetical protein